MVHLQIDQKLLVEFCQKYGIRKLSLFGSVLRDDFGPKSDVDMLVEFQPEHRVGYLALAAMEREMSALLGRKADLRTPAELGRYFRQEVVAGSVVQYAQSALELVLKDCR